MSNDVLWSNERIEEEAEAASTHCGDVDGDWVWLAVYVMRRSTAETLLEKMRDEYEARIAELDRRLALTLTGGTEVGEFELVTMPQDNSQHARTLRHCMARIIVAHQMRTGTEEVLCLCRQRTAGMLTKEG